MEDVRQQLSPWIDWIPDPVRDYLPAEGWALVGLVLLLLVMLLVGYVLRAVLRGAWRALTGSQRPDWDRGLIVDLAQLPAVNHPPSLSVYHLPAWVRMVILAPMGKTMDLDFESAPLFLNRVIPGLGNVVIRDAAELRIWPPPLSAMGFTNAVHRCTVTRRESGEVTGWVVLAGRVQGGGISFFLGLVLWTRDPSTLGRMNLEPREWLSVLRLTPESLPP